jgi:hypothetical protein
MGTLLLLASRLQPVQAGNAHYLLILHGGFAPPLHQKST